VVDPSDLGPVVLFNLDDERRKPLAVNLRR
jgi:hypothetical protein